MSVSTETHVDLELMELINNIFACLLEKDLPWFLSLHRVCIMQQGMEHQFAEEKRLFCINC